MSHVDKNTTNGPQIFHIRYMKRYIDFKILIRYMSCYICDICLVYEFLTFNLVYTMVYDWSECAYTDCI